MKEKKQTEGKERERRKKDLSDRGRDRREGDK